MAEVVEYFIKDSDNVIRVTLTEAGSAIAVTWTSVVINVGPVTITRASNANGVDFTSGILAITPGQLTESLTDLLEDKYRVYITVFTASDPNGVIYGADDSENTLHFEVSDPT